MFFPVARLSKWILLPATLMSALLFVSGGASALELDWSGQFRVDLNFVHYVPDGTSAGATNNPALSGYYIGGGGAQDTFFQGLFARLRPKIIVNDNTYIKSEFWLGDPVFGLFGGAAPESWDRRWYYSTQSGGVPISAQRLWAEFQSDFGTFYVGRMPLHWGLGATWNQGEGLWDRYMSTGDALRWVGKIGSFSLSPTLVTYSIGNSIGSVFGTVADISVALKYENADQELEAGINLMKRFAGNSQDALFGYWGPQGTVGSINYLLWDLYARKDVGMFHFAVEAPIVGGSLGSGLGYNSFAVLSEIGFKPNETWQTKLQAGFVPGQGNQSSASMSNYTAFYVNPSYKLGLLLFNYRFDQFFLNQTANNPGNNANPAFGSNNYLGSPYDAPISNAIYVAATQNFQPWDKWGFSGTVVYAHAPITAQTGSFFFNSWDRRIDPSGAAIKNQGGMIGLEFDLGVQYQWDEFFQFRIDGGLLLPGSYFAFNNTATDNPTSVLWGVSARAGVNF